VKLIMVGIDRRFGGRAKVNVILEQATKAWRGSKGKILLFLYPWRYMGVGGQRHAPADLLPSKTRYPFYRRLCGSQSSPGQLRKSSLPPRFVPRNVSKIHIFSNDQYNLMEGVL
jgi:hypothetical protein